MKESYLQVLSKWTANVVILCLTGLLMFTSALSQNTDNQLYIINSLKQYRQWLKQHDGMHLVFLKDQIKPFYSEVTYTTPQNFTGAVLYPYASIYVTQEAALLLQKVQDSLLCHSKSLLFFDGYRPYDVTVKMWEAVPDEQYAANPANGSGHNRGVAIDLTLADAISGQPLDMPTPFDSFSDTAHHAFTALPAHVLQNRGLLKGIMEHFGFIALRTEWWHYSLPNPKRYPLLNLSFKQLDRLNKRKKFRRL